MQIRTTVIALILSVAPISGLAGELYRLRVDIDGDGKQEAIQVATFPAREEWRSRVVVKIGSEKYSTEFFSAESDLPDIRVVSIDRQRPQRQLLLGTPEAGTCIYHLLAYAGHKLLPVLNFDSGPDCKAPQPLGNGRVSVSTWQGFWAKENRYRLNNEGTALVKEQAVTYDVGAAGVVGKTFSLQDAECPAKWIQPGAFVRVKLYDSVGERYRVEDTDGSCGWIPAADMNSIDSLIKELPWAG
ncbi:hypothetical protein HZU75_13810 [Chitinibacter fontanus]|uniref:Uncharacterized protein n=1 Tax=Chitinibacter fontanus TaxID=1737446 RepID=A0A7D5VB33_9NEIS|nr:hypothetical protein [Chitinibacter fontanus]QLI82515.1 hypothetical protein HZU75_13810 [Chitinibacter fontanus]